MQRAAAGAAVIGGGLLGLEAARGLQNFGVAVDVIHRGPHLMGQQLDAPAGAMLKASIEKLGIGVHLLQEHHRGAWARIASPGSASTTARRSHATWSSSRRASRRTSSSARDCGLTVERGIVVDDQMRSRDDPDIYASANARSIADASTGWSRRCGSRRRCWPITSRVAIRARAYHGSKVATKLKVMGVELASMGDH